MIVTFMHINITWIFSKTLLNICNFINYINFVE